MKCKVMVMIGLICGMSAKADEYGYFSRADASGPFTKTVELGDGDRLVFLTSDTPTWEARLDLPDGNTIFLTSDIHLGWEGSGWGPTSLAERSTITGPCTVTITDIYSVRYVSYRITRASDNSISPANVIVLPADVDGDMQLVFEASDDLMTWDQVYSFTHSSTSQASKFFRTRLIQGP